ncbi:MAG: polysaccharide deacetylase family protein [Solirubrobacteraceae bacterium]
MALAAAGWWGPGAAAHSPVLARLLGVPLSMTGHRDCEGDAVALTFDDGPDPRGTPAVLDALGAAGATATFFLVGEQVRRRPSLVTELVAAGHEPAVHADRHRCQLRLTPGTFADDLARAVATIAEAAGRAPSLYRPPYGAFTLGGLCEVRRAGLEPLLWSRWGRDWRSEATPASIAALATRSLTARDVVLLHDCDAYCAPGAGLRTARALPRILAGVQERGLRATAVKGARRPSSRTDTDIAATVCD